VLFKKLKIIFEENRKENKEMDYGRPNLVGLIIKEPIVSKKDIFIEAQECQIENVKTEQRAFENAKDCQVKKLKAKWAFSDAERCQGEEIEAMLLAFRDAKDCQVKKLKAKWAFGFAKDCQVNKLKAEEEAFSSAERCQGEEIEAKEAFEWAENCLCIKRIKAETIGKKSRGVVILGDVEGNVYPSVILMKGRLPEESRKIEEFFKEELKRSQQQKESIFNPLSCFNWEGENLETGKKILKQRYDKIKDDKELLEKLGRYKYNFYFLIKDNSKREEIFSGLKKLRKVEENILLNLNSEDYLFRFEKVKPYLSLLSLKDWVRIGEYADFLNFEKTIENIRKIEEKRFKDITLEAILTNPENFKLKIAKHIKQLNKLRKKINKNLIEKELQKEIKNKKSHLIREEIVNSSKRECEAYLRKLGFKGYLNTDIVFATRLYRDLLSKNKYENENAKILKNLISGKKPLNWRENKNWLVKMKKKIDIETWLKPYSKEYLPLIEKSYEASLEKSQKEHRQEIIEHLKEKGIEISSETEIEEIERIFLQEKEKIPKDLQEDIKNHFQTIKALKGTKKGMEEKLPNKKIILETEEDPLKTLRMGQEVFGSCLKTGGGHEESVVCNSVDINKKVIWAKDKEGNILARILIGITKQGNLVGFRLFNNDPRLNLNPHFKDFLFSLAEKLKIKLTSEGEIEKLIGENWYDDGIYDWEK